ncbi:MAG TPA: DNA-formamidopyrimidine glycosylase family protein, partial [Verrucomicrobiae bacterium]|nr:DNA-formamidopyrimidine glycosylase family protein [Verrucomicrobiae bacterium]
MPELPEVEMFTRYFRGTGLGRKITAVEVRAPKILDGIDADRLVPLLVGRSFVSVARHGKNLLAGIEGGGVLTMHFG